MNAGKAVYGILSANTGVTDIVGTRIFPEIAEQEAATPFVIYQLQSVAPEDTHDGPSKLDEVRFEFLCYADSYNEAADLGVAVRAALDRVSGTYNGVNVESVQFNDVDVEIEYDPRRYSQVLKFTFRIKRDDITIALGTPVTGAVLDDLSDVKIVGTPAQGDALVYQSGFWSRGTAGASTLDELDDVDAGAPSAGQLLAYGQDTWETISQDEIALPIGSVTGLQGELDSKAESLNDLSDVTITGTPTGNQALIYDATASVFKSTDSFTNRFEDDVERGSGNITPFVERAYGVKSDGDGIFIDNQSDTPSAGKVIKRKIYHKAGLITDSDVIGDYTLIHTFDDDTAYSATESTFEGFRDGDTYGTPPFTLIQTWEEEDAAPSFTGLLNEAYGSGAEAAYSTRRLNGNYSGDCMTIRRASDGTTQSIGFVDEEIDESAIETFCSGTTCTVQVWRDQSGNGNDLTAPAQANEPTIYTGGALVKENGKVALDFDGVNDRMTSGSTYVPTSSMAQVMVAKGIASSTDQIIGDNADRKAGMSLRIQYGSFFYYNGTTTSSNQIGHKANDYQNLHFYGRNTSSTLYARLNGAEKSTAISAINTTAQNVYLAARHDGSLPLDGTMQEYVLYLTSKSAVASDIESNIGDYFTQNTPLLDTYSGAAAAYSLRLLSSSYSGALVEVYNGSSYADIGANVFGELDTVALAAHCGSNDGFVSKWYSQTGSNHATQTTTANMPKIYDGTTGVVTENGKPKLDFVIGSKMSTSLTLNNDPLFITAVAKSNTFRPSVVDVGGSLAYNKFSLELWVASGVSRRFALFYGDGLNYDTIFLDNNNINEAIITAFKLNDSAKLFANGVELGASSFDYDSSGVLGFQNRGNNSAMLLGEVIVYPSDQSANRTNIEDNINTFYNIY